MNQRFEVIHSDECDSPWQEKHTRWIVRQLGCNEPLLRMASYIVACAIARHLNAQDPEPGDIEALVSFAMERGRGGL